MIFMKLDSRDEVDALMLMLIKSYLAIFKTMVVILIVLVPTVFVIYMFPLLIKQIMAGIVFKNIIAIMYNIKRLTAIRTRVGIFNFVVRIFNKLVSVRKGIMTNMCDEKELDEVLLKEVDREFNKGLEQWDELNKRMKKSSDNEIDDYWKKFGLSQKEVNSRTSCIQFRASKPITEVINTDYCIDIRDHLPLTSIVHKLSEGWYRSDMSDEMHVKSIYKRLCPKKGKLNIARLKDQRDKLIDIYDNLKDVDKTFEEKIDNALSTKGSAGQFAKRSAYEGIWKDSSNALGVDIWRDITTKILQYVYLTNDIDSRIVQYMLYRKQEAINGDYRGLKPTRLMNAPNLMCRIVDSVTFSEFNDAMINSREETPSSLGINIFIELKLIHIVNPDYVYITCDYADYDGSQHPAQGFAVAEARLRYMIKHKKPEYHKTYIIPKYRKHMYRTVYSTKGVEYDVIGQQASGDITTSDDNTIKTSAVMFMYIEEFKKEKMIIIEENKGLTLKEMIQKEKIGLDITSDDSGAAVKPSDKFNEEKVRDIYKRVTEQVGWFIKPESFSVNRMGNEPLEYLSHGVKDRKFLSQDSQSTLELRCLVRPKGRLWGKWSIAAEVKNQMSTNNKAKLASKYLTMCMVSIGYPPVILASLMVLLMLRSRLTDHVGSYSWAGVKADTIKSIDLNSCIELQLGGKLTKRYDWIQINDDETDEFKILIEEIKDVVERIVKSDKRIKIDNSRSIVVMKDNWWNYRNTVEYVRSLYKSMDRHGLISTKSDQIKWWDIERDEVKDQVNKEPKRGKITTCGHINEEEKNELISENKQKYDIRIMCKECYKVRKELRYEYINVCMT